MKIAFVTDTGSGHDPQYWQERGIYCLPLQIEYDGVSYDEFVEAPYEKVISNLHDHILMKTSLPKLGKIEELFSELKEQGYDTVFCVPICTGLSGTMDAMAMVAKQLDLTFYGVDCYVTCVVQSHMIQLAKSRIEEGTPIPDVIKELEKIAASAHTLLLCDDLQHMRRGGRLTPTAALVGGLLKIKPVLYIEKDTQGKVDVLAKVRTMSKAQDRVIEFLKEKGVQPSYKFVVAHVDALEAANQYANRVSQAFDNAKVEVINLVSAVGIHTGLGCLAIQVFKE